MKTDAQYLSNPNECPKCWEETIDCGKSIPDGSSLYVETTCSSCDYVYYEVYRLTGWAPEVY